VMIIFFVQLSSFDFRFGRKVVISIGLMVATLGIIKSFSVNYAMMITLETLEASLAIALFGNSFVTGKNHHKYYWDLWSKNA